MTERDNDIEFDFFDEPPTREDAARARPAPKRPRGPRRPVGPPPGLTPLLRLVGLVAFAILIVVLLVFWAQSCQGASKRDAYKSYLGMVSTIAQESTANGRSLNDDLTTPGIKESTLESKLNGLAQQGQVLVARAQTLKPPGPLRSEQQDLLEALQFRVSGLRGLHDALTQVASTKKVSSSAGHLLAQQAERLVASDVVWDDLFKDPTIAELQQQGIGGVQVPDSDFVQNPDLANASSMLAILKRINGNSSTTSSGSSSASGLHGTGIVSVKALPAGTELSTSSETKVVAGTNLEFAVAVKDTGDSQEVQIPVSLTIRTLKSPIVLKQTIDLINAAETKTVVFSNVGQPDVGNPTTLTVDVGLVPHEKSDSNNTATYKVVFSLPGA